MIRAPIGDSTYWQKRTAFLQDAIAKKIEMLGVPSINPAYDPQFAFNLAKYHLNLILRRYSQGASIRELAHDLPGLFDAWELSNSLAYVMNKQLKPGQGWDHRHLLMAPQISDDSRSHNDPRAWVFDLNNLNHYNFCFWLAGLGLALDISDGQWSRLLLLIGGEGRDELLDRVLASRQAGRPIGTKLLHPKPYQRLLKTIDAPKERQASLLFDFLDHWYVELFRKGDSELWWYIYGDPVKHPLEMGSYFGRWCIEAVAAVKAFSLDDSLCLGHQHYPGDLLRPDGPTTHLQRELQVGSFWTKLFGKKSN